VADVFVLLAGLVGLLLGGFYTVCVHRYVVGQAIHRPRPYCPHCLAPLSWLEMIPLASFLALRGRCGHCRGPISPRYPALELLSAAWAVLLAWRLGPGLAWVALMAVGGIFLVAAFIDLEIFILPDILTLPGFFVGLGAAHLALDATVPDSLVGAAAGVGLFWLSRLAYRKARSADGLGFGDVKLMAMIGALTGIKDLPLAILIAAAGTLAAFFLFRKPGQSTRDMRLPFGPFLCLGAMLVILRRLGVF